MSDVEDKLIDRFSLIKKIEDIHNENNYLKKIVKELINSMQNNNSYHSDYETDNGCEDDDCLGCVYLKRKDISEILSNS